MPALVESDTVTLVPWLSPLVENLETCTKFGNVCPRVANVSSSAPKSLRWTTGSNKGDQFTVSLPYAEQILNWNVLLCWDDATIPPEFEYTGDHEFEPDMDKLPEWDAAKLDCVTESLLLLLDLFKQYQCEQCSKYNRLAAEIELLIAPKESQMAQLDTTEIRVWNKGLQRGKVLLVTSISIGSVRLLPSIPAEQEFGEHDRQWQDDEVIIKAIYKGFGEDGINTEVALSPFLNELLSKSNYKIPPMEAFFAEYVTLVHENIENEVQMVVSSIERKQRFICAMLAHFDTKCIEFDSVTWKQASFLLDDMEFHFVLTVCLPDLFPYNQAKLVLNSVYHERKQGGPFMCEQSYRFQGKPIDMVEQLEDFLQEAVPKFKQNSCSQGI